MAEKNKLGKKSRWKEIEEKLPLIKGWARRGLTDKQICSNLNLGVSTFCKYKLEHKELVETLKEGKEPADIAVENALYKRAIGYYYDEVTESEKDGRKVVRKHVVPDTTAQIYWLKNRQPKYWRDRREIQVDGETVTSSIKSLADLINTPVKNREIPAEKEKKDE